MEMKEEWLMPGAVVPVDAETTAALVAEIKRLIRIIGGMALSSLPPSKPWVGLTDEQIKAGARALCKQMAEACGVDVRDQWQLYSDTFKEDAKAVLEAAHGIKGDA